MSIVSGYDSQKLMQSTNDGYKAISLWASADTVEMENGDSVETTIGNIETEIGDKQNTITGAATTIVDDDLTAGRALISSNTGKIRVATTTADEIYYVHGVTSNIQTQLNSKQPSSTAINTTNIGDQLVKSFKPVNITENANLDNYATPGYYIAPNNTIVNSLSNCPAVTKFHMVVMWSGYPVQLITTRTNLVYYRSYDADRTRWNSWLVFTSFINSSDTDTLTKISSFYKVSASNYGLLSTASGNYTFPIDAQSDSRIKKNIKDSSVNALDCINEIKLREYDFIEKKYGNHQDIGYVAQELKEVIPEAVIDVKQDSKNCEYDSLYQID